MPPTRNPDSDPDTRVSPAPQPVAPWRVAAVQPQPGLRLGVTFADGTAGEVRLRDFLEAPAVTGTVFEALCAPDHFGRVRVELGVVTWPNGADLAPDAMYDSICAQGYWTVRV